MFADNFFSSLKDIIRVCVMVSFFVHNKSEVLPSLFAVKLSELPKTSYDSECKLSVSRNSLSWQL